MLVVEVSSAGHADFTWRLTESCAGDIARADFRFLPGAAVMEPREGESYFAPSGNSYAVDIVGAPHPGVGFVAQARGAAGNAEVFRFRVDSSGLTNDTVLWNIATAGSDRGRLDMRLSLCYDVGIGQNAAKVTAPGASRPVVWLVALSALCLGIAVRRWRRI